MKLLKSIFISWDFILSVILVIFFYFLLPQYLQIGLVKEIYGTSITVLEARPKSSRFSGFGSTLRDRPNQE
jgi:hypothetical protein